MSYAVHYVLAHQQARDLAAMACQNSPEDWIVKISPRNRTLDQNAKLWAVLNKLAEHINWYGQKLTAEEWKDVLTASLKKQKVVPSIDGGFVVVGASTSKMDKKTFSDLLELCQAFGAEKGVDFGDS